MTNGAKVENSLIRVKNPSLDKAIREICVLYGASYQHAANDVLNAILAFAGIETSFEVIEITKEYHGGGGE